MGVDWYRRVSCYVSGAQENAAVRELAVRLWPRLSALARDSTGLEVLQVVYCRMTARWPADRLDAVAFEREWRRVYYSTVRERALLVGSLRSPCRVEDGEWIDEDED